MGRSALRAALLVITVIGPAFLRRPAEAAGTGRLRVFILAGQSNMEGQGKVQGEKGTLEQLAKDPEKADLTRHIVDAAGRWVVRRDVWIWYNGRKGDLTVGFGARGDRIGPEFGFGHVVGEHLDDQVLIIKTAWGGKSLGKDFRPPSSGGQVGEFYTKMMQGIKEVLGDIRKQFPGYDGRDYVISGFGWHQGWNDGCSGALVAEYEENMANFIRDVRKELDVPKMPFVIANSGFGGWNNKNSRRVGTMKAQLAVAEHPEFRDNVFTVETRDFFRPPEVSPSRQGYHWNSNAETYFLIGDSMGKAMVKFLEVEDAAKAKAEPKEPEPAGPAPGASAAAERRASQLYRTARQMEKAGLRAAAARLYKKIVDECPDSSFAPRAAERLK
ncbi:MAG: sialate O-acetylesterase [Planctomycetota bacterium]|jgi:alpha-galactosidase